MAHLTVVAALLLLCAAQSGHASLLDNVVSTIFGSPGATYTDKPAFCHDLDCPPYEVKDTIGYKLELRAYDPAVWVSTNVSGTDYDKAVRKGFWRLFKYIGGNNEDDKKIDMTAPVRVKLIPGPGPTCESTFVVSFYAPFEYQAGGPPEPSSADVFISREPAASYYVLSYAGFTSQEKVLAHAQEVVSELDDAGVDYNFSHFFSAGYDSPFRLLNRHNEIWVPASGAGAQRR